MALASDSGFSSTLITLCFRQQEDFFGHHKIRDITRSARPFGRHEVVP